MDRRVEAAVPAPDTGPPGPPGWPGAADLAGPPDLAASLARAQRGDPHAFRALLRALVGLDAATAAQVLGKRPGAVRTAAHRGLRTLARHLDHAGHRALRAIPSPGPQMPRNAARRDATEGVTGARDSTLKDMR